MKIWRAMSVLRRRICPDPAMWPAFVTNAFRRFLVFATSVQLHLRNNDQLYHVLPPLDVCWVWHSLLMAPAACYLSFAKAGFSRFLYMPFPLNEVADAIDSSLFHYLPDSMGQYNFNAVTGCYGFSLEYEFKTFDPNAIFYTVYCPATKKKLGNILLAQFVSPAMLWRSTEGWITHQSLWRRQMDADLAEKFERKKSPDLDELPKFLGGSMLKLGKFSPLVHLTVRPDCLRLCNWVPHLVHSHVPSVVENLDWLYLPRLTERLQDAIDRYRQYWRLVSRDHPGSIVPTLDIRVVWSAHLSNFAHYADYSISHTGSVVVPADAGTQTTASLHKTARNFRQLFGCHYCECKCWFCARYNSREGQRFERIYSNSSRYSVSGSTVYLMMSEYGGSFSCARHIFELLLPTIDETEEVEEVEVYTEPQKGTGESTESFVVLYSPASQL